MRLILLLISAFCSAALAEDWLYYGGNQGGAHHSELRQINRANVASLELAWSYRTGAIARHPEQRASASFHATPILLPTSAGQSLVFCTPFNRIIALDPVSGAASSPWIRSAVQSAGPTTRRCCSARPARGITVAASPTGRIPQPRTLKAALSGCSWAHSTCV
jgi:quinoprotein glucose dehydrogenase